MVAGVVAGVVVAFAAIIVAIVFVRSVFNSKGKK